jgi:soluble lytic murein transglycosylase-like protein
MINQESGFQPDAVSSVGAGGIAQFMPATWTAVVEGHPELAEYGATPDPQGRFNPRAALYAAAAHLADLLRQTGGDYAQALGAYYAGFGNRTIGEARDYAGRILGAAR